MKTWQNRAGGSREDYDEVLARKVLKGGQGRSSDWCQGEDGKGKERESSTFTSTSAEGQGEAEGESESQINQLPDLIILAGFMHILSPNFLEIISKLQANQFHALIFILLYLLNSMELKLLRELSKLFKMENLRMILLGL